MSGRIRRITVIVTILFTGTIVTLDQILKKLVEASLSVSESIPIVRNILHITYIRNTGILFGMFKGYNFLLIFISALAILGIIFYMFFGSRNLYRHICLVLILSGAIGNLIDRFLRGYIVDFIDIRIWPVFNLADTAITIGIILLGISLIRLRKI